MIARFQGFDPNEPAVTNPELAKWIDDVRRQPPPEVRVTAEQLHEGWRKRHHRRILGVTAGLMATAAASWLVMVVPRAFIGDSAQESADMALDQRSDGGMGGEIVAKEATRAVVQPQAPVVPPIDDVDVDVPLESELEKANEADARPMRRSPGPSALARRADRYLAAGDREHAIETWKTLVTRYPKASTARGALLDLGRAYRATGQRDRARCAYKLFLERWPYSQLRGEVERALSDLGEGPCRGLTPG